MTEIWKEIPGFPKYEASNFGQIRSLPGKHKYDRKTICILSPTSNQFGHLKVNVAGKWKYIHDLVASTFICPRPLGWEVNHIDANPQNNNLENLEWVSHWMNVRHAVSLGNRNALTKEEIKEIIPLRGKMSSYALAKKYLVNASTIQRIWIRHSTSS